MFALFGFFLLHVAVWTGLILVVPGNDRVPYDILGDATTPWVRQFHVALLAVLVLQVVYIGARGWWTEVLFDRPRSSKWWMWIAPALMVMSGLGALGSNGLSDAPGSYWVGMTITMMLVGLTEELSFRGILVTGARKAGRSERTVMLFSSVLFGLFHLPNWWLGQDLGPTLTQVVVTALVGAGLFGFRRASGSLIPCVVLHAAYDWMLIQGAFN